MDTANFTARAVSPELATTVAQAAEDARSKLARAWFGGPFPDWSERCPIDVTASPTTSNAGNTRYRMEKGEVYGWNMDVQGTERGILDSVIPHEVIHTLMASHFRSPVPRWADEGFASHVEAESERSKLFLNLLNALRTGHRIEFGSLFAMREYPKDPVPFYAHSYTLAAFLIAAKGERHFLAFVGGAMRSGNWNEAIRSYYGYPGMKELQDAWLEHVKAHKV